MPTDPSARGCLDLRRQRLRGGDRWCHLGVPNPQSDPSSATSLQGRGGGPAAAQCLNVTEDMSQWGTPDFVGIPPPRVGTAMAGAGGHLLPPPQPPRHPLRGGPARGGRRGVRPADPRRGARHPPAVGVAVLQVRHAGDRGGPGPGPFLEPTPLAASRGRYFPPRGAPAGNVGEGGLGGTTPPGSS